MKGKRLFGNAAAAALVIILVAGLAAAQAPASTPLGTGFTYQGQLKQDGNPVDRTCDFEFSLWDAPWDGNPIGSTQSPPPVSVADGTFTVQLDFGTGAFQGDARWLEVAVCCPTGCDPKVTLTPRQALTASPYALALPGLWTQQNVTSPNLIGGYSGNEVTTGVTGATIGGGGVSGHANRVTDNRGVVGGGAGNQAGNNAGTVTDAFDATVAGGVHNTASGTQSAVGGGYGNRASGWAATVGGGEDNLASEAYVTVSGGYTNTASARGATIGGGDENTASGNWATVGGGWTNTASTQEATIGGGHENSASGLSSTVGGGWSNIASNEGATVGGGEDNLASGIAATVGGGWTNTASTQEATIGGGHENSASGLSSTVGGGWFNTASDYSSTVGGGSANTASGFAATVPGGAHNEAAGAWSFAAGLQAKALHDGTFVWADSTGGDFASDAPNQFLVRATYGVKIVRETSGFSFSSAALQVDHGGTQQAAWFYTTSTGNDSAVLKLLKQPASAGSNANFLDGVEWTGSGAETRKFHIDQNGTYIAGSDFAEALPAAGDPAGYEPGDVLVISLDLPGGVEKCGQDYDGRVVGVYSTRPGFLGADKGGVTELSAGDLPVAVLGIVPVKVSAENGPIRPGDLLTTSSTPGHAMRCEGLEICFGRILGKALEGLPAGQATGVIRVLITLQ